MGCTPITAVAVTAKVAVDCTTALCPTGTISPGVWAAATSITSCSSYCCLITLPVTALLSTICLLPLAIDVLKHGRAAKKLDSLTNKKNDELSEKSKLLIDQLNSDDNKSHFIVTINGNATPEAGDSVLNQIKNEIDKQKEQFSLVLKQSKNFAFFRRTPPASASWVEPKQQMNKNSERTTFAHN